MAKKQTTQNRSAKASSKSNKSKVVTGAARRQLPGRSKLFVGGLLAAGLIIIGLGAYSVWQNYSANAANWGNKVKICNSKYSNSAIKVEAWPEKYYRYKDRILPNRGKLAKRCYSVDVGTHKPVVIYYGQVESIKVAYDNGRYTKCESDQVNPYNQTKPPRTSKVVYYKTFKKNNCRN